MNSTTTRLHTLLLHLQNPRLLPQIQAQTLTNPSFQSDPHLLSAFAASRARLCGTRPSRAALCAILRAAAAASGSRRTGEAVHCQICKQGFASEVILATGLLSFYAKHGFLDSAEKMFAEMPHRDVVACNAMMAALSSSGRTGDVRRVFEEMSERSSASWNTIVSCYCRTGDLRSAREIFEMNPVKNVVSWNMMIDGYCKVGWLEAARDLFDSMGSMRDVVTWNTMITGYLHRREFGAAVRTFQLMQMENVRPTEVTMVSVLTACAHLGDFNLGRWIHVYIQNHHLRIDVFLGNALIDMYFKCGSVDCALEVFNRMPVRNLFCWNSVIVGLGMNGYGQHTIKVFLEMDRRIKPDGVTFVGLLSACSHSGLVSESKTFFSQMQEVYGVEPNIEHYGCIVDLLCRARFLEEAMHLIETMPIRPNAKIWGSLLHACQIHKDVKVSERVTNRILESGLEDGANFGLSNMHASLDRWNDVEKYRRIMIGKGVQKVPGCSSTLLVNETV